jgi:hypothetical protein
MRYATVHHTVVANSAPLIVRSDQPSSRDIPVTGSRQTIQIEANKVKRFRLSAE